MKHMKTLIKSTAGKIILISIAVVLLLGAAFCGYHYYQYYQTPKFQNVTIELGSPLPELSTFMTDHAKPNKVAMVTPSEQIDLTLVGQQTLVFSHGRKTESVILTIVDTTAPTAVFHDVTADIDTPLTPADFVSDVFDLSATTVDFTTPLIQPKSYGDATVELVVTDAYGNQTKGQCFVYYVWMQKAFAMELGDTVEKADLLLNPQKDDALLDQAVLDEINASPPGIYTVTSTDGSQSSQCVITVTDTLAPTLEVRNVSIDSGESVSVDSFIVNLSDASNEITTAISPAPNNRTLGKQTLTITATDSSGNTSQATVTLSVYYDTKAPYISGLTEMNVEKNSAPDYEAGVSARDGKDGTVSFSYDASKVDLTTVGTYYVSYTATDSTGNTGTYYRKVVVSHDSSDTAALVSSIAAGLDSSVESLRNYVRSYISYSYSWGGGDPVWYGFKNRSGNCYVHAMCLQALLREKGYSTQLIWCQDKSHYWNLVYINGSWKHVDSTPSSLHSRYSLMNDEQRYSTLSGRDWDRELWPECP